MLWKRWLGMMLCTALGVGLLMTPVAALSGGEIAPQNETMTSVLGAEAPAETGGQTLAATRETAPTAAPEREDPAGVATPETPVPAPSLQPDEVLTFYDTLTAAQTAAVVQAYREALSDKRFEALWNQLTPDQQAALTARWGALPGEIATAASGSVQAVTSAPPLTAGAPAGAEKSPVTIEQKVGYNGDGSYALTLTAWADGASAGARPVDVVLAADENVPAEALSALAGAITARTPADTPARACNRIAIAGAGGALEPATAERLAGLQAALAQRPATGETARAGAGLTEAAEILQSQSDSAHSRAVIYLNAGGAPTTAEDALAAADAIKNEQNATIYTVGLGEDARPLTGDGGFYTGDAQNAWLHALSSNAPAKTGVGSAGATSGQSYYLAAGDTTGQSEIFTSIAGRLPARGNFLNGDAVTKIALSGYFCLPADAAAGDITLRSQARGSGGWAGAKERDGALQARITGTGQREIEITGYDFAANAVSETSRLANGAAFWGRRLVVSIPRVLPDDGASHGGQGLPFSGAAVYANAADVSPAGSAPDAAADVAIHAGAAGQDQYVYLMGRPSAGHMLGLDAAGVGENIDTFNDRTFVLYAADGAALGQYSVPAGKALTAGSWQGGEPVLPKLSADTSYTFTMTAAAAKTAAGVGPRDAAARGSAGGTACVRVLKPVVTCRDTEHTYGTGAVDYSENVGEAAWSHPDPRNENGTLTDAQPAVQAALTGQKPRLRFTCSPAAGDFSADTAVAVEGADLCVTGESAVPLDPAADITFARDGPKTPEAATDQAALPRYLTGGSLPVTAADSPKKELENDTFMVRVSTGSLTITNQLTGDADPGQTFLFTITRPDGLVQRTALTGAGSLTIDALPVGQYTVAENTDWSWRYQPAQPVQTIILQGGAQPGEVVFANRRATGDWLGGQTGVRNLFHFDAPTETVRITPEWLTGEGGAPL